MAWTAFLAYYATEHWGARLLTFLCLMVPIAWWAQRHRPVEKLGEGGGSRAELEVATFTTLERAALESIFSETPEHALELLRQLDSAVVTQRENSGSGFFTTLLVAEDVPTVNCPGILGNETHAHVEGLQDGLGFVLFLEGGKLKLLESYSVGGESTTPLDLHNLRFELFREQIAGDGLPKRGG